MAKISPEERAEKLARNLKNALDDIRKGVDRVSEAPGKLAAAKKDKMRANLMAALDSGKWERNVAAYPLDEWKEDMKTKGINNIPTGIDRAKPKIVKFAQQQDEHQAKIDAKLKSMPDLTLEDNIRRMELQVREMAKFSFKK